MMGNTTARETIALTEHTTKGLCGVDRTQNTRKKYDQALRM